MRYTNTKGNGWLEVGNPGSIQHEQGLPLIAFGLSGTTIASDETGVVLTAGAAQAVDYGTGESLFLKSSGGGESATIRTT